MGSPQTGSKQSQQVQELKSGPMILDITMPRMSRLEASSQMRKLGLLTPHLIFTTHQSGRLETEVRKAGAQGYVLKSQVARKLVQAIDALLAGGSFFGAPPKAEPAQGGASNPEILFRGALAFAN